MEFIKIYGEYLRDMNVKVLIANGVGVSMFAANWIVDFLHEIFYFLSDPSSKIFLNNLFTIAGIISFIMAGKMTYERTINEIRKRRKNE